MAVNSKKKSFIFNVEWQEILLDYPAEVRLEVYDAIIEYVAMGTISELKPMAKMAFSFIKKEIDYNTNKYNDIVAKRSEAGKKGMASRYVKGNTGNGVKTTNVTNDNKTNKCCHDVTNVTVYDNDNVYDNDLKENNHIHDYERKQVSFPTMSEDFLNFNNWLKENCPFVLKVATQMTEEQYNKILGKYSKKDLCDVLENLNNWKDFPKKRTSVYRSVIEELKKKGGNNGTARGFKNAV